LDKYDGDQSKKDEFARELFAKLYSAWNVNTENIRKIINKFEFDVDELRKLKGILSKITETKDGPNATEIVNIPDDEMALPGKKQEKRKPETKEKKKEKEQSDEVNLQLHASETIAELISLLNIFTLYSDEGSKCVLNGNSKPDQIKIVSDVREMKEEIFDDIFRKEMFLKIINGRLTGKSDEEFPEEYIDGVLNALTNGSQKMQLNKIVLTQKQQYYTINEPDKLLEFINGELKPKEKEKKENGEVFTPISLVIDMVDKLDEAYTKEHGRSIFSEKDFKWFDPAVGIGNFPIVVYQRLMIGLSGQITDEESRRKWILEHMLYSAELTPKNVFIYRKIFCSDSYRLNVYEGDTLKMDIKTEFRLPVDFQGFDVILGNPPYNANGTKHVGDKNIYVYFSTTALKSWLKTDGYLLFIHPPVYRIPHHKIQHTQTNLNEIYTSNKILCIKMFSISQVVKLMSVMINVDFIIIQNTANNGVFKSDITDIDGVHYKYIIKPNEFIPNFGLNVMKKLKDKNQNGNIQLNLDSEIHTQKTTGNIYKNIHGIISNGIKICMSDKKHKYFDLPKLIINGIGSYNYVFYDKKGEYGMSEKAIGIISPSHNTIKFIESPLFHYISNSTKIIGNNFNIKTAIFLPIIPDNININDVSDLYSYFGFTTDEVSSINEFSIPKYNITELSCDGKSKLNIITNANNINKDEQNKMDQKSPEIGLILPSSSESKKRSSKISIPFAASKSKRKTKKQPVQKKTLSPISPTSGTPPGKIYNPLTKRFLNDTKANRKRIGLLGGNHRKTYKKQ
jgi:hypothetical protein